ncbi:MAG: dienelactone hydrolase family protein [Gammaproteobacteria bacterium]|nr:dienelactone hydrolase family protein [Gammaproteobacteria bacterium]
MDKLTAADGHTLEAYQKRPKGKPRGGIVIAQEIFGVNEHIKEVVDQYASLGFAAIAPAYFDRVERGITLPYDDLPRAREYVAKLTQEMILADTRAAMNAVADAGPVAVIGYCWGGTVAYLAACHLPVAAGISYYGTRILHNLDQIPQHPMLYHWAEFDRALPLEDVERIKATRPEGEHYVYEGAKHGFNCTHRDVYDADAAELALERTSKFLARIC